MRQPKDRGWSHRYRDVTRLCRRLGLGLLTVGEAGVTAHLDPGPYAPRRDARRAGRLLREFERRAGDPEAGGTTGVPRMTAYRQDALRCVEFLAAEGPARGRDVARGTGVARATRIMADDHHGWFERVERGVYALSPNGRGAAESNADAIVRLRGD
ncbi:MAG: DUF2161 domain-containing phosphodiesterase [Pseudomonadota bacterium]